MWPGSSVSGLYIGHPDSYYFGVAKVERDQIEDYARRKENVGRGRRTLALADPQLTFRVPMRPTRRRKRPPFAECRGAAIGNVLCNAGTQAGGDREMT